MVKRYFIGAVLAASLLSGCAVLPGQGGDYSQYCSVRGTAQAGEIYRVQGSRDFWLTPAGNYLSDSEYHSAATRTLDEAAGLLSRTSTQSAGAVRARVFLVRSESSSSGACLPVTERDPQYRSMTAKLTAGRRLQVASDTSGVTGSQVYQDAGSQGFRYRVL